MFNAFPNFNYTTYQTCDTCIHSMDLYLQLKTGSDMEKILKMQ